MSNKEKILFYPNRTNDWIWFMDETIKRDKDKADPKPHGWHWFWGLYHLRDKIPSFDFDLKKILDTLPDEHWLKIAEQKNYYETAEGPILHKEMKDREDEFKSVKSWVNNFTRKEKITKIDLSNMMVDELKDFSNFIFPVDANFKNTKFSKDVLFENAVFFGTANFENVKFHKTPETHKETAKFKDAVFKNTANFNKAIFNAYANFKGAHFGGRTIFQQAEFGFHAPRFYGATFNNEIILNRIKLPEAKKNKLSEIKRDKDNEDETDNDIYQKTVEENKSAYETLIYLMGEQHKHHDRHRFFREEMRWRQLGNILTRERRRDESREGVDEHNSICRRIRHYSTIALFWLYSECIKPLLPNKTDKNYSIPQRLENNVTIAFFWLYEKITDYGYSIGRAFSWWLGHIFIGVIVIAIISWYACIKLEDIAFCSVSVSVANANPFVFIIIEDGSLMDCYEKLNKHSPMIFGVVRGIQTFIGVTLLFLLLTTLRIRFRLK